MNFLVIYKFYYGSHFQDSEFKPSLLTRFDISNPDDLKALEKAMSASTGKSKTIQPNHHFFRKDKNVTIEYQKDGKNLKRTFKISDVWVENRFDLNDNQLLAELITHVFLG